MTRTVAFATAFAALLPDTHRRAYWDAVLDTVEQRITRGWPYVERYREVSAVYDQRSRWS